MEVVITAAIISASAAVLAGLGAQIIANVFAGRREDKRRQHERELKKSELEDKRQGKLREERLRAYTHLLAITATIKTDEPYRIDDLAEALSVIQLMSGSDRVRTAAGGLYDYSLEARQKARAVKTAGGDPGHDANFLSAHQSVMVTRTAFLEAAREELGLPPKAPPVGLLMRETSVPAVRHADATGE